MAQKVQDTSPQPQSSNQDPVEKDLGFGNAISERANRLINSDGSMNVKRVGTHWRDFHLYNYLIGLSWRNFWLILAAFLILLNLFFAGLYMLVGIEQLSGLPEGKTTSDFGFAFYFSVQTFTTVGYGALSPTGHAASLIASIEAMMGLIGFAFATGLLYGRFARPTARILFSEEALIAPYKDGMNGLMFRIVNGRQNQLIEMNVKVIMSWFPPNSEQMKREFAFLELERSFVSLFPLSWTIVHPIDDNSPLRHYTNERLRRCNPEFLITIKAFDDSFAQEVHARGSYKSSEVVWGGKFEPMFYVNEDGETVLEMDKLSNWREANLN